MQILSMAAVLWLLATAGMAPALEIRTETSDLGPFGRSLSVSLSGEINRGDALRIAAEVAKARIDPTWAVNVSFDSPGGSLLEGMAIGRYFDGLAAVVSTDVSRGVLTPADCASACVLAYLGGHYRYLTAGSRLGVHQFYLGDGAGLSGSEGVEIGQALSAEIVRFLTDMRADPNFFGTMTKAHPQDIFWVPREDLEAARVVTGNIFAQRAEYQNANGVHFLSLWQQSRHGENKVAVTCGDEGVVFLAHLQPPDLEAVSLFPHSVGVTIDGSEEAPADYRILPPDARWARAVFTLSPEQLVRLVSARSFGARMMPPGGQIFFGFEFTLEDDKLRDTIRGCALAAARDRQAAAEEPGMTILRDIDLPGGDMFPDGLRDLSFSACQAVCLADTACAGVTWVAKQAWCWPKSEIAASTAAAGLLSAVRN